MTGRRLTSRSAFETALGCRRQRFLGYEFGGAGLRGTGVNPYLTVGSAVHEGIKELLKGRGLEAAVKGALGVWWGALEEGELVIAPLTPEEQWPNGVLEWQMKQEAALVEGLVRAWDKVAGKRLREEWEVLEVERELEPVEVAEGVWLQAKADTLQRNRATGVLAIGSWKALQQWGPWQEKRYRVDVQGVSEAWMMDRQMEKWAERIRKGSGGEGAPEWMREYVQAGETPKVGMVQMGILLKGRRTKDERSEGLEGRMVYGSPLTKAWRHQDMEGGDLEGFSFGGSEAAKGWAWSWEVPKESKSGETYMGTLGSKWRRVFVWEGFPGGVAEWVEALDRMDVQPQCGWALEKVVVMPEPWVRQELDMESRMRQIGAVEYEVKERSEAIERVLGDSQAGFFEKLAVLDELAPQNTKHCYSFGGRCPFFEGCHGANVLARVDPRILGGFGERRNHHELVEIEE